MAGFAGKCQRQLRHGASLSATAASAMRDHCRARLMFRNSEWSCESCGRFRRGAGDRLAGWQAVAPARSGRRHRNARRLKGTRITKIDGRERPCGQPGRSLVAAGPRGIASHRGHALKAIESGRRLARSEASATDPATDPATGAAGCAIRAYAAQSLIRPARPPPKP
ncbi:hypothetical protein [Paracoccus sp. TOH]|uniref:hypothetical protein n=1 Tax=Paracoccus sp. TOH TaxID=1263728 RepID=UPI0025B0B62A|nr:hypothetical protein [Paracoccus sp. TOH]WJS86624.1 hypothetical protein NBE95_19365 [Paracoccus sp. TOH]